MHSDSYNEQWNSFNSIESCSNLFQDDSKFRCEFSSGVKTIATVSVESGVIQFGSTEKIMERLEFLDETKRVFQEIKNLHGIIPLASEPSCLNNEANDLNELFASLISSANFHGDIANILGDKSKDLGGNCLSPMNLQSTASDDMGSADKTLWCSTWSTEHSLLASYDPHLASDIGVQDSLKTCRNTAQDSTLIQGSCGYQMDNQQHLQGYPVEFNRAGCITDVSRSLMDDLSQWFAASPEQDFNGIKTIMNGDLSPVFESTLVSPSLVKGDTFINLPIEHPATSMQSSITNAFSADAHEKSVIIQSSGNDLFNGLGTDRGCGQVREWEDSILSVVSGDCLAAGTDLTKEAEVGSAAGPRRGLFSELGLEELLNGMNTTSSSMTKCSLEDQLSTRKRKLESSSVGTNQVRLARLAGSGGSMHLTRPLYNLDKTNCLVPKKEVLPKSQVGLWIDDSYSVNARSMSQAKPQKAEDHTKTAKKRAKPGESTRPRPKDRQQIQDRIKDLRGMIPNGGKQCSIDYLLDRTIKYMIFLQGLTKHADKLKQPHEPKENGVVLKDHSSRSGGNNTWALAVEGQNVVCPILVEDLSTPGQMVIEILCEERGFFLELADEIRGFGLNILKGVMESREDKIWARFIVEKELSSVTEWRIKMADGSSEALAQQTGLACRAWLALKGLIMGLILKVCDFFKNAWDLGQNDPRKVIHCLKVGMALTVVSLFYYMRPLYEGMGGNAMWAVMTVVVVFENTVGATICKCLNRICGTFIAGSLAIGIHWIVSQSGKEFEPFINGISVFLLASAVSFSRFIPSVKKRFDYGAMIFILTFSLVTVSGYRVDKLLEMANNRVYTIIIGTALCIMITMIICPIWAGEELYMLITRNMDKLAYSLDGCVGEYFNDSGSSSDDDKESDKKLLGYKCVLTSKATEEAMANFARWEPAHGRFNFRHPWKQYLKVGASMRACAYCIDALDGCVNSENEVPELIKKHMSSIALKVSSESSRVIKDLARSMKTMKKSSNIDYLVGEMNNAVLELQEDLKSLPTLFINPQPLQGADCPEKKNTGAVALMDIMPLVTLASLLIEITTRIEGMVNAVEKLAEMGVYKSVADEKNQNQPVSKSNVPDEHKEEV